MAKFLSQYSRWIIIGFGLLVFWLTQTSWLTDEPYWQKAEGALIDRRYLLRGPQAPVPAVVLVGIGTTSFQLDTLSSNEIAASPTLQLMREPWPWNRKIYADILEKLVNAGARVVMFDFVFASEKEGDDEFARALQKHKDHVVIGQMIQEEQGTDSRTKRLIPPNPEVLLPGTEMTVGVVDIPEDTDQVVRLIRYRTSIDRETLELSGLDPRIVAYLKKQKAEGKSPDDLEHVSLRAAEKFQGPTVVPSPDESTYIDFQGGPGTYRALPVENMFVDALWKAPPFEGGLAFKNKVVIVGPMAEILHDVHTTPFGEMPGPEIQAQILAALLKSSWLAATPPAFNVALALIMLLFAVLICISIRNALLKVALLVVVLVVFFVVCQILFTDSKLVLPMMSPLVCLVVPSAFGVAFQFALEQLERLRTRSALDRMVSPNVAKLILDDRRDFEERQKGSKQAVTILFSDIRGFTSMTETVDAHQLVAQLNEYFLEMGGIIRNEDGTLSKYIGDAIMAVWGDTHSESVADDARRAARAALQMRGALAKLNAGWKGRPDREQLKIGVGVNHGEVIVGEIGHPKRTEFTVLGDGVNLAARLESSTKQFHTDILVGEETEKLTRDHFLYRNVGAIAFKGKTKPVETFMLLGDRSQPAPDWLNSYHAALRTYRSRKFETAKKLFEEAMNGGAGNEDYLCNMYLQYCAAYLQDPPPANWDGSITLTEK